MGTSRWDEREYTSYSLATSSLSQAEIFTEPKIHEDMDPKNISFREARDSENHPNSTPIIIGLDVTGSMGMLAEYLAKTGLGVMVNQILERRPVTDPAICIMAIGDAHIDESRYDRAPLQVGQFESDIVITDWLEKIFLEGGGGGNDHESYDLPYYFALYKTRTDASEKRNQPGVLITIGDEMPNTTTYKQDVSRVIGDTPQEDIEFSDLVANVRHMYTPYHIVIAEGDYARRHLQRVKDAWRECLGNGALVISDHRKTAELIVSMLKVDAGVPIEEAIGIWPEETQVILRESFADFMSSGATRLSRRMDIAPS